MTEEISVVMQELLLIKPSSNETNTKQIQIRLRAKIQLFEAALQVVVTWCCIFPIKSKFKIQHLQGIVASCYYMVLHISSTFAAGVFRNSKSSFKFQNCS